MQKGHTYWYGFLVCVACRPSCVGRCASAFRVTAFVCAHASCVSGPLSSLFRFCDFLRSASLTPLLFPTAAWTHRCMSIVSGNKSTSPEMDLLVLSNHVSCTQLPSFVTPFIRTRAPDCGHFKTLMDDRSMTSTAPSGIGKQVLGWLRGSGVSLMASTETRPGSTNPSSSADPWLTSQYWKCAECGASLVEIL